MRTRSHTYAAKVSCVYFENENDTVGGASIIIVYLYSNNVTQCAHSPASLSPFTAECASLLKAINNAIFETEENVLNKPNRQPSGGCAVVWLW